MIESGSNTERHNFSTYDIYANYSGFIRRIIYSRVKNCDKADDIFQELFLHLVINPITSDVDNIEKYLYRTTANCVADYERKSAIYRANTSEYISQTNAADKYYCPDIPVINSDEAARMLRLMRLRQFNKRERRAIRLRWRDGHEMQKIASIMGVKEESASRYIAAGLTKIRSMLTVEGENHL